MQRPFMPPKYKSFLSPEKVVESLNIQPGEKAIDFGCGSGFWTIPLAKKAGAKGAVYAIDPREEKLSIVRRKAESLGLGNIVYIKAPFSAVEVPVKEKVDYILISHVLSDIHTDLSIIFSLRKVAHPETKLIVFDWNEKTHLGPEAASRTDIETTILTAEKSGFKFSYLLDADEHHFGLLFEYKGA